LSVNSTKTKEVLRSGDTYSSYKHLRKLPEYEKDSKQPSGWGEEGVVLHSWSNIPLFGSGWLGSRGYQLASESSCTVVACGS